MQNKTIHIVILTFCLFSYLSYLTACSDSSLISNSSSYLESSSKYGKDVIVSFSYSSYDNGCCKVRTSQGDYPYPEQPYDAIEELTFPSYSPENERVISACIENSFESLKTIHLPSSIINIPQEAFKCLGNLQNINITASVKRIGTEAFCDDVALPEINLPKVKVICERAFQNCASLSYVDLGDSLIDIQESAFSGCSILSSLSFPTTLKEIGYHAFEKDTSLKSVTIPGNTKRIGNYAFFRCDSLKFLTIQDGVESIGACAFEDTSIEKVFLPKTVTELGKDAITNQKGHTTVYCEAASKPEGYDLDGYQKSNVTYVFGVTRQEFEKL